MTHRSTTPAGSARRTRTAVVATLVAAFALALTLGLGPLAAAQNDAATRSASDDMLATEQNTVEIVERYGPSVVAIAVTAQGRQMAPEDILENIPEQFREFFAPRGEQPQPRRSAGSGFVVDDGGRIVTNLHVVEAALMDNGVEIAEGASISVRFPDTDEELPVTVIGANPDIDVALLELEDPSALPDTARAIPVADSDSLRVGQKVIAIGNPFGLRSTVTTGIVSAIERDRPGYAGISIPFVQTDAAINPGNSGGPLLNSSGELIGINNAIISPSGGFAGIGFAVPSNLLVENLDALAAGGLSGFVAQQTDPDRPLIGIVGALDVEDYPESVRTSLDLPENGVVVTGVGDGTPAAEAGIQGPQFTVNADGRDYPAGGDIVTEIDGVEVGDIRDIQRAVLEREPGDTISLTLWRAGDVRTVEVELAAASEVD